MQQGLVEAHEISHTLDLFCGDACLLAASSANCDYVFALNVLAYLPWLPFVIRPTLWHPLAMYDGVSLFVQALETVADGIKLSQERIIGELAFQQLLKKADLCVSADPFKKYASVPRPDFA